MKVALLIVLVLNSPSSSLHDVDGHKFPGAAVRDVIDGHDFRQAVSTPRRGQRAGVRPGRSVKSGGMSNEQRAFVLHSINELRRNVRPPAANMIFTARHLGL